MDSAKLSGKADVLIAGGGPAGCAAAIWLARRGRRVILLEKGEHPRFHIGESLLPMSMPLLADLGVLDEINACSMIKRGADFPDMSPVGYHVFRFENALHSTPASAVQIRRADLDRILFERARAEGVEVLDHTRVRSFEQVGSGVSLQAEVSGGGRMRFDASYFIDATGRDTLLGNQFRLKERNRQHQSAAVYAHFTGVDRREGEDEGNISIYRTDDGWVWVIPLTGGVTSIGLVCGPASLRGQMKDSKAFLLSTLHAIPALRQRLRNPVMVGNLEATGNYSYSCRTLAGRGWVMIGDAGAFLDPIFSSGVHVALESAREAAFLVDAALDEPSSEVRLQRRYQQRQRAALRRIGWFIQRFNSPIMRHLFSNPRNTLRVGEALVSMLAGDLYRNDGIAWRLTVFKIIYALHCAFMLPHAWRGRLQARRRQQERFVDAF